MPRWDWECPKGHVFEADVRIADREKPLPCTAEGCDEDAQRIAVGHSSPGTMLDYGLGLNREALEKGTYDPLKPIQRGVRRHRGEKAGYFG